MTENIRYLQGSKDTPLLECQDPVLGEWCVRWKTAELDGGDWEFGQVVFGHKPTLDEVRHVVISWHNARIDERILSGFRYEGAAVWLSTENQFNYKSAADLALQTGGATLPITFKLGTETAPVYRTFEKLDELTAFYTAVMAYIQATLAEGWKTKDAIDWSVYE